MDSLDYKDLLVRIGQDTTLRAAQDEFVELLKGEVDSEEEVESITTAIRFIGAAMLAEMTHEDGLFLLSRLADHKPMIVQVAVFSPADPSRGDAPTEQGKGYPKRSRSAAPTTPNP